MSKKYMTGQEKIELMKNLGCPNIGGAVRRDEMILCEEINRLMLLATEPPNKVDSVCACGYDGFGHPGQAYWYFCPACGGKLEQD